MFKMMFFKQYWRLAQSKLPLTPLEYLHLCTFGVKMCLTSSDYVKMSPSRIN